MNDFDYQRTIAKIKVLAFFITPLLYLMVAGLLGYAISKGDYGRASFSFMVGLFLLVCIYENFQNMKKW